MSCIFLELEKVGGSITMSLKRRDADFSRWSAWRTSPIANAECGGSSTRTLGELMALEAYCAIWTALDVFSTSCSRSQGSVTGAKLSSSSSRASPSSSSGNGDVVCQRKVHTCEATRARRSRNSSLTTTSLPWAMSVACCFSCLRRLYALLRDSCSALPCAPPPFFDLSDDGLARAKKGTRGGCRWPGRSRRWQAA